MLPNEYEYIPACGGSATITAGRGGVKQGETAVLGVINGMRIRFGGLDYGLGLGSSSEEGVW